jgi:hypothetical protein
MGYEYKALPAPQQITKTKGAKTPQDRFARMLETTLNAQAADGWEFQRSETLPCAYRTGWLRRRETGDQTMLIFRRIKPAAKPVAPIAQTAPVTAPAVSAPATGTAPAVQAPTKAD